ncbi:hypothetical protein [Streptomyces sp. NPDC049040]|uniref:hypothetical protein n=1 Tax=Streptomyces sp. NPDC049040 TaxID=3365593 RepID=UPI0037188C72
MTVDHLARSGGVVVPVEDAAESVAFSYVEAVGPAPSSSGTSPLVPISHRFSLADQLDQEAQFVLAHHRERRLLPPGHRVEPCEAPSVRRWQPGVT